MVALDYALTAHLLRRGSFMGIVDFFVIRGVFGEKLYLEENLKLNLLGKVAQDLRRLQKN